MAYSKLISLLCFLFLISLLISTQPVSARQVPPKKLQPPAPDISRYGPWYGGPFSGVLPPSAAYTDPPGEGVSRSTDDGFMSTRLGGSGELRHFVMCKDKGPCYGKKLMYPDYCVVSGDRGSNGGCVIDCKDKCIADCSRF